MFNEGNQIHNFMSSYGSGYGSGSTSQKVTVPTVPVPVPQHCLEPNTIYSGTDFGNDRFQIQIRILIQTSVYLEVFPIKKFVKILTSYVRT
jgi:hypothetical protein